MKHPALTRAMAVVLAVLSLVMLLAGFGSLRGARRDRDRGQGDWQRLSGRIDEYELALAQLGSSEPYDDQKKELDREQAEHDQQATEHRMSLAKYTATRSGVQTGLEAMNEATYAFYKGKEQYEDGVSALEAQAAAFEEGYRQFQEGQKQLESGRQMLNLISQLLGGLRAQSDNARAMAGILDSDDPEAARELSLRAYDGILQSLDSMLSLLDTLKAQNGISPDQIAMLTQLLSEQTELELDLSQLELRGVTGEEISQIEDAVAAATGMMLPELRQRIQQERDRVAAQDPEEGLSEEQLALIRQIYDQNREAIQTAMDQVAGQLPAYEQQVAEALEQMNLAQEQLDAMAPMMEAGREGIEQARQMLAAAGEGIRQGEKALYQGKLQLQEQQQKLIEQEKQLRREKRELDKSSVRLTHRGELAEEQKEKEQRETSLRLMLLDRQEIRDRVDAGEELLPAARAVAQELRERTDHAYTWRVRIAVLMLLGAVLGFAAIPAAFERIRSRLGLLIPGLGCALCAAGAEILCRLEGRGDAYSALACGAAALLVLLAGMPRIKRKAKSEN